MADAKPTLWQWRVRLKPDAPRSPWFSHKTWKMLRWRMTEADATVWGDKNGCDMQRVANSGMHLTGYLGITTAVMPPDENSKP